MSRGAWLQAYELLMESDARTPLSVADLGLLADTAYAAGHLDVTIATWERAYAQKREYGRCPCGCRCGSPGRPASALRHSAHGPGTRMGEPG